MQLLVLHKRYMAFKFSAPNFMDGVLVFQLFRLTKADRFDILTRLSGDPGAAWELEKAKG